MIPYDEKAYQLLHDGAVALGEVESNGIHIDVEYLDRTIRRLKRRIEHLKRNLDKTDVMREWRNVFKGRVNINSNDQLGQVLFDVMKFDPPELTGSGRYKTDEKTLQTVDHPFVQDYLKIKKLQHSLSTYLVGIRREVVDGFLHPFYNLHLVRTYRSSSDSPNFQNIPIRDPAMGKMIRQAFIPRPGGVLVESDYGGVEVVVATCYHQDPAMIDYLEDKTKDMHRDMAMECYRLPLRELIGENKEDRKRVKNIRYAGKNAFVFPQFYGDWYIDCARELWNYISTLKLHKRDGTGLKKHLRSKGITELGALDPRESPKEGTFERHIQMVEKRFWSNRFPIYNQWRRNWVEDYQDKGWMLTKTGFICQGWMKRNEIINYPVQGSAFHLLLWSLIRLQKELKRRKMKSLIVGQIHDSIISDVPEEELDDFLQLTHNVMVDKMLKAHPWINVPIEIEAEVTPVDGNWFEKEEMKIG